MKIELPEIRPEEQTPLVEALLGIIRQLMDRVQQLEQLHQELRDELAVWKGQKPRPKISPSILEKPEKPKDKTGEGRRRGQPTRPKTAELNIHKTDKLYPPNLPAGATWHGFESQVVQELNRESIQTKYERARFDGPEGGSVLAPFPAGVWAVEGGHWGPKLIASILDQYHQAGVTEPLLWEQLGEYGIAIAAGQLHRLRTEDKDLFHHEKAEVLVAGLTESSYLGTDDTGARPQGKNGSTTALGNEWFASFESTDLKGPTEFRTFQRIGG